MKVLKQTSSFLRGVKSELKKVVWIKKKELIRYTIYVVMLVVVLALFFTAVDTGISALIRLLVER